MCDGQVMTPQRLELLKVQMQNEMEAPVRERFNVLEEVSSFFLQINDIHSFLRAYMDKK